MSFVDLRSFKTNKIVILFCKELESRSRNLNQCKSKSLLSKKATFPAVADFDLVPPKSSLRL